MIQNPPFRFFLLAAVSNSWNPGGCLVVSGALACGEEAGTVRRELARLRQAMVAALRERFERAVQDGNLLAGTDCATLAVHGHGAERPGRAGGPRGDREGAAAGCG